MKDNKCKDENRLYHLYAIEYTTGKMQGYAEGTAVVKAETPKKAINILQKDGQFNAARYNVVSCEEIVESLEPMLLAEKYVKWDNL